MSGVIKINTNGVIDTSFNGDFNSWWGVYALAQFPASNSLLVGGDFQNLNGSIVSNLVRLGPNGAIANCGDPINLAPPVIAVSNITDNSFMLSWSNVPNATKYKVKITTSSSSVVLNTETTSNSYTVTGLQPGSSYICTVRSANNSMESVDSNILYATTTSSVSYSEYAFMSSGDPCMNPGRDIYFGSDNKYYGYDGLSYIPLRTLGPYWWKLDYYDSYTQQYYYNIFVVNTDSTALTSFSFTTSQCGYI